MKTKFYSKFEKPLPGDDSVFRVCEEGGSDVIMFSPVELPPEESARIMEEIEGWELVDTYRWHYEDLSYNDESSGSGERIITDSLLASFLDGHYVSNQVRGGYLLDQGHFAGYVLKLESTSSYGMAVHNDQGLGVLLTDGRKYGKTDYHYFHCSTEIDEERSFVYSVRKKAAAE
ncbi:MAG: hypothetical protein IJM90_09380 [Firmicutes bacterium]|nr:hypothetical protein [Bacillota bacterium]